MEKEIEFQDEQGKTQTVKLRRLKYGEYSKYEEETVDTKIIGGQPIVKVSTSKLKTLGILKSVVKSTVPINNLADVEKLDRQTGDKLYELFVELNSQNLKKNE